MYGWMHDCLSLPGFQDFFFKGERKWGESERKRRKEKAVPLSFFYLLKAQKNPIHSTLSFSPNNPPAMSHRDIHFCNLTSANFIPITINTFKWKECKEISSFFLHRGLLLYILTQLRCHFTLYNFSFSLEDGLVKKKFVQLSVGYTFTDWIEILYWKG